jgi:hypothetical protein
MIENPSPAVEETTMSAPYAGFPAARSVEQAILLAQLELLRRLDPTRVDAAKAVLLRN